MALPCPGPDTAFLGGVCSPSTFFLGQPPQQRKFRGAVCLACKFPFYCISSGGQPKAGMWIPGPSLLPTNVSSGSVKTGTQSTGGRSPLESLHSFTSTHPLMGSVALVSGVPRSPSPRPLRSSVLAPGFMICVGQ